MGFSADRLRGDFARQRPQRQRALHTATLDRFFGHAEDDAAFFVLGDGRCPGPADKQMRIGKPRGHVLEIGRQFGRYAMIAIAFAYGIEIFRAALLRHLQPLAQRGRMQAAGRSRDDGSVDDAVVGIVVGFGLGRALGLNPRMALLVACGNAICGNSAIAAVAPVIDADGDEVAASIAFTAVLGVIVVLALPLLGVLLQMSTLQFGALAGLTVYAVPQVLAAAAPFGPAAAQTGTVVKLVRVLMLGPVVFVLSLVAGRDGQSRAPGLHRLVPWFILGFLVMIGLRSLDLIPQAALPRLASASGLLTVIAMAALGLQTEIRAVARAGGRVAAAVVLSLAALLALALLLIRLLGL